MGEGVVRVGSKAWKAVGWLLRPVQFAVLAGLVSLLLSYAFDWAHGWDLAWSFSAPVAAILAIEGLERLRARWRYGKRPASPAVQSASMENLRRAYERIEASKRTVLCSAEREDAVRAALDRENVAGLFKVEVSEHLPENSVVVMDEAAIRASFQQNLTNPMTFDHPSWFEMDRARLHHSIRNGGAQLWKLPERSDREEGSS